MAISRRFFLKSGSLTAIAASVAFGSNGLALGQKRTLQTILGNQTPMKAQREPTFMFTRATFEPYVGGIFQAANARGRMVSLTLLSVTANKSAAKISTAVGRQTDSFSLMFKARSALSNLKSIHNVSHPSLGKFDLFLTPREKDGAFYYEAVFNHI